MDEYFPLTIAMPLADDVCGLDSVNGADVWFSDLESIAISTLQHRRGLESLIDALAAN